MLNFSLNSEQKLWKQMFICKIKSSQDSWSTKFSWSWRRHSSRLSFQLIMYKYENANATCTSISSCCQLKTDETNSWTEIDLMHSWNMWKTLISNIIFKSQILIESSRIIAVKFVEDEKNENMNLQLCKQTFNVLSEWKSVRRSLKNNVSIDILKSDAFMINILFESTNALKIIMINLNALFNIMSQTSDNREIHLNVQITQKVFALSMLKSAV